MPSDGRIKLYLVTTAIAILMFGPISIPGWIFGSNSTISFPLPGSPDTPVSSGSSEYEPAANILITEKDAGKTIEINKGRAVTVELLEKDSTWHLIKSDNIELIDEVLLESYPAKHRFTIRVNDQGGARFVLVRGEEAVIDELTINFNFKENRQSGRNGGTATLFIRMPSI